MVLLGCSTSRALVSCFPTCVGCSFGAGYSAELVVFPSPMDYRNSEKQQQLPPRMLLRLGGCGGLLLRAAPLFQE